MFRRHCLVAVVLVLWFLYSSPSSLGIFPEPWVALNMYVLELGTHNHLLSALLLVGDLRNSLCLLLKEASLMKSESYTYIFNDMSPIRHLISFQLVAWFG